MKKQKEHALPQRHNLVSHFLIHLLRLRILVALRRINLSKKGRLLLLFKKGRQKADVEDRELLRMHLELIMLIQAIQFRFVQRPG